MLQQTVEDLTNNDIAFDYFKMLRKIIEEDNILQFQGYDGDND